MPINKFNMSKWKRLFKEAGIDFFTDEQRKDLMERAQGIGPANADRLGKFFIPTVVRMVDDGQISPVQAYQNILAEIERIKSQEESKRTPSPQAIQEPQAEEAPQQPTGAVQARPEIEKYVSSNLIFDENSLPIDVKQGDNFAPPTEEIKAVQNELVTFLNRAFNERISDIFLREYVDSLGRSEQQDGEGQEVQWQGKMVSAPNDPEFARKFSTYQSLPIVPRRSHGRMPPRYRVDDFLVDSSMQSVKFLDLAKNNPRIIDEIVKSVSIPGVKTENEYDAVLQAVQYALSPKFSVVSYMPGVKKVQEIEDKHDGRIEFILLNPKILEVFDRFSGLNIINALMEAGIDVKDPNSLKRDLAYVTASKIILSGDNGNKLTSFIDNIIEKSPDVIQKWIKRYAKRILTGEFYKSKANKELMVEDEGERGYEREGEALSEQHKEISIEERERQVEEIHKYLEERFLKMKDVAEKIIPYIRSLGVRETRGDTDHNITAMVLENLINSFGKKLEDLFKTGKLIKMSDKFLSQGKDFIFRKMITDFGGGTKKGNAEGTDLIDGKVAESSVVDNFSSEIAKEEQTISDVRSRFKRGESIDYIAQSLGVPPAQISYYLTVGKQNIATRAKVPTFEEYKKIISQRVFLNNKLIEYKKANQNIEINALRNQMISLINANDLEAGFTDKELREILNSDEPEKLPSEDELQQKYQEKFSWKDKMMSSAFRKRIIGDELRYNIANWAGELLRLIEEGKTDIEAVRDFVNFIRPHGKIMSGKSGGSYNESAKILWRLRGYSRFEDLPEEIQKQLSENGITTLEPKIKDKKSSAELMILLAFARADKIIGKLWETRNSMVKTASRSVGNIDSLIRRVAGDARREIEKYNTGRFS